MKYFKSYDSQTLYDADKNTPAKKTDLGISLVESKALIRSEAVTDFGDIVYYDNRDGLIRSSSYQAYVDGLYHILSLVPIGVVAVPGKYTPDNTTRIVSLVNMSVKTPNIGTVADGNSTDNTSDMSIYWGGYGVDLGLTNYPNINSVNPLTGVGTGTTSIMRIPSDVSGWTGYVDPISGYRYYYSNYAGSGDGSFGPSPFLADGSKNSLFFSPGMATNDFDGRTNTTTILNAVTVTGWQTSTTLTNNSNAGNYPAAMSCWRYSTPGTSQGDWYLPAEGELTMMVSRSNSIATSINSIKSYGGVSVYVSPSSGSLYGEWCWSSTEYDLNNIRCVYFSTARLDYLGKNNATVLNRVRAFTSLNPIII